MNDILEELKKKLSQMEPAEIERRCEEMRIIEQKEKKLKIQKRLFELYNNNFSNISLDLILSNNFEKNELINNSKINEYITEILNKKKYWLFVSAPAGNGKTTLATYIATEIIKQDVDNRFQIYYFSFYELISAIEESKDIIYYHNIIIIDDFLRCLWINQKETQEKIREIIDYLYSKNKIVIFLCDMSIEDMKEKIYTDIQDQILGRLREKTNKSYFVIKHLGKDYRK